MRSPILFRFCLICLVLGTGLLVPAGLGLVDSPAGFDAAALVLGQANFTTGLPGSGPAGTAGPSGVAVDPTTGKVFVADTQNHRVLRFAAEKALANGAAAEAVLGQANLSGIGPAVGRNRMDTPMGVWVDSSGRLWVADRGNHRVLRFDTAASKPDGAEADGVLGQPDFSAHTGATAKNRLQWPAAVSVDPSGRLWVADTGNHRVLRFDNAAGLANGADASGVLGQLDFSSNLPDTNARQMAAPSGVVVDSAGRLWVADRDNSRVLRFDAAASQPDGADAKGLLGQTQFNLGTYFTSQNRMNHPAGVAVDASGRLWVADMGNQRGLWFDNAASKSQGSNADGVLGQPDFNSGGPNPGGRSAATLFYPNSVFYDSACATLWVADTENQRVLAYASAKMVVLGSLNPPLIIANGDTTPSIEDGSHFGALYPGASFLQHSFQIANHSLMTLTLSGGSPVQIGGANPEDFSVNEGQPATVVVGPYGSTEFMVGFAPASTGLRSAQITIANSDANANPYTFAIQGYGVSLLPPTVASPANGELIPFQPGEYNHPLIRGTAEPFVTVIIWPSGGRAERPERARVEVCSTRANASGAWSCRPPYGLPSGLNQVWLIAMDDAGNVGTTTSLQFSLYYVQNLPLIRR